MERNIVVQKIVNKSFSPMEVAVKYYYILSILNELSLTNRQIELIAFMAIKGSISPVKNKELFSSLFGSPKASIGNMVWALGKKGIIVRKDRKYVLNPKLQLDFSDVVVLHMTLKNEYNA